MFHCISKLFNRTSLKDANYNVLCNLAREMLKESEERRGYITKDTRNIVRHDLQRMGIIERVK